MNISNERTSILVKSLSLLCLVGAMFLTCLNILKSINDLSSLINQILSLFALFYAVFYIGGGYTKNSAKYYKNFGIILLTSQAMIVPFCCSRNTIIVGITSIIMLIALLILVLIENLGKTLSLTLCGILLVCEIIALFFTNDGIIPIYGTITKFITYLMYGVFTYAKYLDKTARGSK